RLPVRFRTSTIRRGAINRHQRTLPAKDRSLLTGALRHRRSDMKKACIVQKCRIFGIVFVVAFSAMAPVSSVAIVDAAQGTVAGGPTLVHRLTQEQYRNIVTDLFGDDIALGARLEPDVRGDHLIAVGSARATVTAAGMEQYEAAARSVA